MVNYLTSFSSITAYNNARNLDYPNVSLIESDMSVMYQGEPYDYSKDYFTIVSEADNNEISINHNQYAPNLTVSASTDGGVTWSVYSTGNTIALNTGGKLLLKGVNNKWAETTIANTINSTDSFYVEGNIMSLLYGDNFSGQTSLANRDYAFFGIFSNNTNLTSAENLILPATTLSEACYREMFKGCTSLTSTPELSAAALSKSCYSGMFSGCTSLTTAPELHAETLSEFCYNRMFSNCASLNYIKCLATDNSPNKCTDNWLYNVASTGTFVKNPSMISWTRGSSNGIPDNWTVEDAT